MRILIPAFDYKPQNGGVATYTYELALELQKQKHDILVLAPHRPGADDFDKTSGLDTVRYSSPQKALLAFKKLPAIIAKQTADFNPDIIFCPLWFPDAASTHLTLKLFPKTPLFIAAHGTELSTANTSLLQTLRNFLLKSVKQKTFKKAKNIFAVSHNTKNIILEQYPELKHKTLVVSNGVNLDIYRKIKIPQPTTDAPRLLTVSRLIPSKGIDSVLYSLPDVIKIHPQLKYTIVGSGPDKGRLQDLIRHLQLENHAQLVGFKTQEELVHIYNSNDLFILLSKSSPPHIEGFGLVFLEAAACELPSLGARSGGIPDAVLDGHTGWLIDTQNTCDITHKLLDILADRQLLKTVAQSARENAQLKTWQHSVEKILKAINAKK